MRISFCIIITCLFIPLIVGTAEAQNGSWLQTSGPVGGVVTSVATRANGDLFAGTIRGGVFRGTVTSTAIVENTIDIPSSFALEPNYPNPFNPQTTIGYSLPEASLVRMVVYDALGRQVAVLVDGMKTAGKHEVVFEAGTLLSGLYLYRMTAGGQTLTGRMLLLK